MLDFIKDENFYLRKGGEDEEGFPNWGSRFSFFFYSFRGWSRRYFNESSEFKEVKKQFNRLFLIEIYKNTSRLIGYMRGKVKIIYLILVSAVIWIFISDGWARRIKRNFLVLEPKQVFRLIPATSIRLVNMPPELKSLPEKLKAQLREKGLGIVLHYLPSDYTFIAFTHEAYEFERPDLLRQAPSDGWLILPVEYSSHGRDLQLEFVARRGKGVEMVTMVIKGCGKVKPSLGPYYPGQRVIRPYYINVPLFLEKEIRTKVEEEIFSPQYDFGHFDIIGGMSLEYASREYLKSLALHKLLMAIDGRRADVPIYTHINIVEKIPVVVNGEERMVSVEEYFTSPEILTREELLTFGYELARRMRKAGSSYEQEVVKRYLDLLWSSDYRNKMEENQDLMQEVRKLIKDRFQLATLTKVEVTNLRISNLNPWGESEEKNQRKIEFVKFIYGEDVKFEDVAERIAISLGRTLGALHGAGGVFHLLEGPDMKNPPRFSIADKDVTITGEIQDLADQSFFPFWNIDEPAIAEGYDIPALQQLDIRIAQETISNLIEYLDKLGLRKEKSAEEITRIYLEYFHRIYAEYYAKAQEIMECNEEKN
jgi:hypothetical protein